MLDEFIQYLAGERRYSPLTVRNYRHDIEQFYAWLDTDDDHFDPHEVTAETVREWILFRTEQGRLGAGSINREVSSLRSYFKWMLRRGLLTQNIFLRIHSLQTSRRGAAPRREVLSEWRRRKMFCVSRPRRSIHLK